jgi:hypothetical protein
MGGESGEVRGKTKIETYVKYVEYCESWAGGAGCTQCPESSYKKVCYKEMQWDPAREEWVLQYHLHT